jgi:SAM-dependent methyltransferase
MTVSAANDEQARYWNGDEAAHWLTHEDRYEAMLAPFTGHLLKAAGVSGTDRVLDVGCGCGSTTRAAGRLATDGDALGVDLSRQLLHRAEQRTREEGLANVRFEHADVQVHPFTEPVFDAAISRFGVMFFADPVTAFANIGRALRPGGRMVFVCWAEPAENEWITVPGAAAAQYVALPPIGDPAAPGPFSLADRNRLVAILDAAGLAEVDIECVTDPLRLGSDVAGTVEFVKQTGIGQALLKGADPAAIRRVTDAFAAVLEPYLTTGGVWLGSKAWLVWARRPASCGGPQP